MLALKTTSICFVTEAFFYRGICEAQIFWLFLLINFAIHSYRLTEIIKYSRTTIFTNALSTIIRMWIMIAAMLHQPHNVILLPLQIIVTNEISSLIKQDIAQKSCIFLYALLGNVFYFYQVIVECSGQFMALQRISNTNLIFCREILTVWLLLM